MHLKSYSEKQLGLFIDTLNKYFKKSGGTQKHLQLSAEGLFGLSFLVNFVHIEIIVIFLSRCA